MSVRERPTPVAVTCFVVALVIVVAAWFVRQVMTYPTSHAETVAAPAPAAKVAQR